MGKLQIVASADLHGLGPGEGAPVIYDWAFPSVPPLLAPWLAILGLLMLRPNRRADAWWIWAPLVAVALLTAAPPPALPSAASFLLDVSAALAVSLSAVWLLSNSLRRSHRALTFLCVLLTLAGCGAFTFLSKEGSNLITPDALSFGIVLAVNIFATSLALTLGGWICRGRYRPLSLYLWLYLLLIAIWLAIATPIFLVLTIGSGRIAAWSEFYIPVLTAATLNYATLLPFLILSSANPLFRERFKALLHIQSAVPPQLGPALHGPNLQPGISRT